MKKTMELNKSTVPQPITTIYRLHMFIHSIIMVALIYYRVSNLFKFENILSFQALAWVLITFGEFSFILKWFFGQGTRWRPVERDVFPENITCKDSDLPPIDVMVFTANPKKEPIVDVMNTVISAMALDYPTDKLAVYLADDGGCPLSLYAMEEACVFAKLWLPFCRKYGIKTRCPKAFFSPLGDDDRVLKNDDFDAEMKEIKLKYEVFQQNVERAGESGKINGNVVPDRASFIKVINDRKTESEKSADDLTKMPLLVYVSRERRFNRLHHFKGGSANALLRVSGIMSNAPYILVLDCDFFCHDPISARKAMCFHLDPKLSSDLAYVQFPQVFYNVSKSDIYDVKIRQAYKTIWHGMDGIQGPVLSGTGYFLKRKALYTSPGVKEEYLSSPEKHFGRSKKFLASLEEKNGYVKAEKVISEDIVEEAKTLATCAYEDGTHWGQEIGYSYDCHLESTFTGYLLHCKGWRSTYLYPDRPSFLGCAPVDMQGFSSQLIKWVAALTQAGLSHLNPITYGLRSRMKTLQCMCYAYLIYFTLYSWGMVLYASIPSIGLLFGFQVYPEVHDPWFAVYVIAFISTILENMSESIPEGGSFKSWWMEYRALMMMGVSAIWLGGLKAILDKIIGTEGEKLYLSDKAIDKEKLKKYEKGKFDFQGIGILAVPLIAFSLLNLVGFIVGANHVFITMNYAGVLGQLLVSSFFVFVVVTVVIDVVSFLKVS
ncbi:cellulose synthase-like protein G1 [Solanum verrucosum]|uniref:cellulose synthase-like protein G1 n=1 Tax=Solanum verrucosum TaxID=315347 RepID=UPI0020D0071B|nr:cellulose synthase-like protein G1 [Solanum verrucosum]